MAACPKCGHQNSDDGNFCSRCGTPLNKPSESETTISYAISDEDTLAAGIPTVKSHAVCTLVIRSGGDREGEEIPLELDLVTIGRSPDSQLFLDDVTVSRHHARVVRDATGFVIEDQNSLNGTYVNRRRVERHHLADGDELQIGKFKLAFTEPKEG